MLRSTYLPRKFVNRLFCVYASKRAIEKTQFSASINALSQRTLPHSGKQNAALQEERCVIMTREQCHELMIRSRVPRRWIKVISLGCLDLQDYIFSIIFCLCPSFEPWLLQISKLEYPKVTQMYDSICFGYILVLVFSVIWVTREGTMGWWRGTFWQCLKCSYEQTVICTHPYLIKKVHRFTATGLQTSL
jgi:hypothetical protein